MNKEKPDVSINNTQLWNKYPEYDKDIKIIESELSEYLYPFEDYHIVPSYANRTF